MDNPRNRERLPLKSASYDKAVDELADIVIENVREDYHSEVEPFEAYAQKVRAKIHGNLDQFRERFSRGYQLLLDQLQK